MRTFRQAMLLVLVLFISTMSAFVEHADARSVHATSSVDLLEQGSFSDSGQWSIDTTTSFSLEQAEYTEAMVMDNRLSFIHQRPINEVDVAFWSQFSSSDSNFSLGAPDGASTWTTGPEIVLESFSTTGYNDYEILDVHFVSAFQITDTLQQDTIRISLETSEGFDVIKNFAHTPSIDHINNSAWRYNLSSLFDWSWDMINTTILTFDYVSAGGIDDARLVVDAAGIEVTVKTPWYGGEVASASTTIEAYDYPLLIANLSAGTYDGMTLSACGIERSSSSSSVGIWESEIFERPPEQRLGRIHYQLENDSVDDVSIHYRTSNDGVSFTDYEPILAQMELPDFSYVQFKIEVEESCISSFWIDVNDPSLHLTGRIVGDIDGIDPTYSRWLVFVDGEVIRNEAISIGDISMTIPVGKYLPHDDSSFDVEIKAWFTWDSLGNESTTMFELSNIDLTGPYEIQWDEDPECEAIGIVELIEDAGGIIMPFIERCSDDRHSNELLSISFENSNPNVVNVDLTEGQIRIILLPEASGQAMITVTVTDPAGNSYIDTFEVIVSPVNDAPVIDEFPGTIPLERDVPHTIIFSVQDTDSTSLTASSNKSWVNIDMENQTMTITSPNTGYDSILFQVCDEESCTDRIIDIDSMAMPDLVIEDVEFTKDLIQSQVLDVRIYVRNVGQADATMISVRCETDGELVDFTTISMLQPGQISVAICEWGVPNDRLATQFDVIVDRGLNIQEGNELNNEWTSLLTLEQKVEEAESTDDSALEITPVTSLTISIIFLVVLMVCFILFAPAKIKKIE